MITDIVGMQRDAMFLCLESVSMESELRSLQNQVFEGTATEPPAPARGSAELAADVQSSQATARIEPLAEDAIEEPSYVIPELMQGHVHEDTHDRQ